MQDHVKILTAESVTEGHPDKICDLISDSILDACLENDPHSRVACECMATAGKVIVAGEITTAEMPDIPYIVSRTIKHIGYDDLDYEIEILLHEQSGDIAGTVGNHGSGLCFDQNNEQPANGYPISLGAGDQGIVYGYATNETMEMLPLPVVLAHRMTRLLTAARRLDSIYGLMPDGKSQISIEYVNGVPRRATSIILSTQHAEDVDMEVLRKGILEHVIRPSLGRLPFDEKDVLINPSERFVLGGFEADTGLTGRKLMVDTYGGFVPHGGGALSGKDATKVDRSGAYMARYIAKNIIAAKLAGKCTVSMAYAIGKPEPVAVNVDTHDTGIYDDSIIRDAVLSCFDLTPSGMIRSLQLYRPIFAAATNYGHFTHEDHPWERLDMADALCAVCMAIHAERR